MSVRNSLAWMTLSQVGVFILQFASTVALARMLTPRDMGIYAAGSSITGILGVLQTFGVASFVIREPVIDRALLASAFTVNAAIAVLLSATIVALSAFGGRLLHSAGVAHVMMVLSLVPLIGIVEFLPAANLERDRSFKTLAVVGLGRSAIGTITTISLALAGWSYMSIALGAIAASLAGAIAFTIVGRAHVGFRVGFAASRRILRFGLHQIAIQGVDSIAGRLAEFLMGRLLGLSALGVYGRAASLNNALWSGVHIVVGRVLLAELAKQGREGGNLRPQYLQIVEIMTALLWPCFAGLSVLSAPLIALIYGDRWLGAARPLSLLAFAAMISVTVTMSWELFVVCQETGRQARIEIVRSSVGMVFFLAGCLVGITAAASARVAEALVTAAVYRPHVKRMTSTRSNDFSPIYLRSGALTLLACGPAAALMSAYHWSAHIPLVWVASSILLGGLAWLAGLKALDHVLLAELHRVASRLAPFRRALAE